MDMNQISYIAKGMKLLRLFFRKLNQSNTSCDFVSKLPQDIIFMILSKLPTKSLIQLMCVSKLFNSSISEPHFLKTHIFSIDTQPRHHHIYQTISDETKFYFSYHDSQTFYVGKSLEAPIKKSDELRLVGSTRGVVCLCNFVFYKSVGYVILWNPLIGKFKTFPPLQEIGSFSKGFSCMVVGFGFDYVNIDFKVVKILYNFRKNEPGFQAMAWVYGEKIGSWKRIEKVVPCYMSGCWSNNVCVNGVVYWLANKRRPVLEDQLSDCIMAFDVIKEVFQVVKFPQNAWTDVLELRLCTSPDEKSVTMFVSNRQDMMIWNVWEMKNLLRNKESWEKKYCVFLEQWFILRRITSVGNFLVEIESGGDRKLALIDAAKEKVKDLSAFGLPHFAYSSSYTPSLVLLAT